MQQAELAAAQHLNSQVPVLASKSFLTMDTVRPRDPAALLLNYDHYEAS